jgi:rubredoxin
MTDDREQFPCARGCTWEGIGDEPPRPKAATHGHLCSSDFYRLKRALEMIPDLMLNMRANIGGIGVASYGERVSGGGGNSAPIPLKVNTVDAADSLYAKLASWARTFTEELHVPAEGRPAPELIIPAWSNSKEVQGSLPVTDTTTYRLADQLTKWFLTRLDAITATGSATAFHDDICYGWEDAKGVFSLSGSYGVEPRPTKPTEKRECPLCGDKEVFVKFPNAFDGDLEVMCARCQWVADPALTEKHLKAIATG